MILHILAAAQVAVVGPTGPVLQDVPEVAAREETVAETYEAPRNRDRCLSTWRAVAYGTHIADGVATAAGIKRSKLREGNPVAKALGMNSALGVVAFKGAIIGLTELQVSRLAKKGKDREACSALKISTAVAGIGASLGLYYNFK